MDFPIDQLDIKKDMIKKCSNNIVLRLIFVPDNDGLIPPECTIECTIESRTSA